MLKGVWLFMLCDFAGGTGSNSPSHSKRGRSPPSFGPADSRSRAASSGSITAPTGLGVQLRNKEGKRVPNPAARRSKNLDKNRECLENKVTKEVGLSHVLLPFT